MSERRDLWTILEALSPYVVPPAFGALIATRWTRKDAASQPRASLLFSALCSFSLGGFLGPAVAEHYALGQYAMMAIGFVIAILGMEIIALIVAALRQWAADPVGTFARWRDAFLGRNTR